LVFGFAGAPWTVACYLVEGKGKQGFQKIVEWSERDPKSLTAALEKLSGATSSYLNYQIHSGANLIQLFDTWLPSMPMDYFKNYYAPMMESLWKQIGKNRKVPRIYFAKGAKAFLPQMIDWEIEVVGVDSSLSLKEAEVLTHARFSLQGNLSSEILFEPENEVRNRTRRLVVEARQLKKPAILNLGHGILPKTPVENAKAFVTEARSLWI
jgi:uroporphyrinogen decarboxylase